MEATGSKDRGVRLTYSQASTPSPIASQTRQYPSAAFARAIVPSTLPPEPIAGGGDPRSMFPVRLAGAEVAEAFWANAAGLS